MRKIILTPDTPFNTSCDVKVYDVTDGKEKKRCQIKIEYAMADVRQLRTAGMDYERAMEYYREWIYDVVKHYIVDDWECVNGMEDVMKIVSDHIAVYFEESGNE